jgi:hypothetical protein
MGDGDLTFIHLQAALGSKEAPIGIGPIPLMLRPLPPLELSSSLPLVSARHLKASGIRVGGFDTQANYHYLALTQPKMKRASNGRCLS